MGTHHNESSSGLRAPTTSGPTEDLTSIGFYSEAQIHEITTLSRTQRKRLEARGEFPAP